MPELPVSLIPGSRHLPVAIDIVAKNNPTRAWACIPKSSNLSDGYYDVSFRDFANAINRAAWFIESKFGKSTAFEPVGYIGKPDMRYHVLAMAAAKTGYQVSQLGSRVSSEPSELINSIGSLLVSHQQSCSALECSSEVRM